VATGIGAVLAVGGAYNGPFPADGLIPVLKPLYDYSWVVGLVASLLTFVVLSRPAQRREPVASPEPAAA
jgi:NCS1 family nucleobase:cation symporter-1